MTPALAIVILVVLLLVAFVVMVLRATRRMEQESTAYLHELAPRLGATIERESPARLTGERDGRRFIVSLRRPSGRNGTVVETWIEIPVSTTLTLQVQPQTSDLGAGMAGDQEVGDPDFDAACFIQSTDPELVRLALDDGMRAMLVETCRTGDFRLLVVHKQWLRFELRGAPDDPENEPMVTRFLQAGLTLAGRLDAGGSAQR